MFSAGTTTGRQFMNMIHRLSVGNGVQRDVQYAVFAFGGIVGDQPATAGRQSAELGCCDTQ